MNARSILSVAAGDPAPLVAAKIDGLRKFLLLYGATRSWLWLIFDARIEPGLVVFCALGLSAAAALAWVRAWACFAPRIALVFLVVESIAVFPYSDNHFVLEVLAVGLVALVGRDGEGEEVALGGLLWVTAVVFFQSGLQKVLYGQYFGGEFLAFMVGRGDRFGDVFGWLLSAAEMDRLAGYDPLRSRQGPYRVASFPFLVASNAVYLLEMVLAPLLLLARTRFVAALVSLTFVLFIQLGAREVGFALLFGNLLLLFTPSDLVRRLVPFLTLFAAWVVLTAAGILPGGSWIERGWM